MSVLPWLTLANVIWLQAIGGTNMDFSAYSSELKSRLGINQVQLNNLAVASDAGKLFGWIAGAAADRLPLWSVLVIGIVLGAAGYGVQFLFLCHKTSSLSYIQFFFLNMISGNSVCWLNTVGYVAVMRQFLPKDHGTIIALTTSYTGLTAKIYIAIAEAVVGKNNAVSDTRIYLLLNAVTPALVGLFAVPSIASIRTKPAEIRAGLLMMFGIAVVTGAFAVIETMLPALRNSPGSMPAAMLLAMMAAVIGVPARKAGQWAMRGRTVEAKVAEEVKGVETGDVEGGKEEETEGALSGSGGREVNVKGALELVKRVNFWVYFMVYLCGPTLGFVFGNNIGQISDSRGVSESVMLSISSSFGFFGRLAIAPLSALSRSKKRISKTGTIAVLMAAMAASFFLLLSPCDTSLFAGTAVIGLCTGAITSTAVSVSAELFGRENFGVNHNIVITNIPIGSFMFGSIAAIIYDKGEGKEAGLGHGLCLGMECYRRTFILYGCICSFGTLLSFFLYARTRKSSVSSK